MRHCQLLLKRRVCGPNVHFQTARHCRVTGQEPEDVAPGAGRRAVRECRWILRSEGPVPQLVGNQDVANFRSCTHGFRLSSAELTAVLPFIQLAPALRFGGFQLVVRGRRLQLQRQRPSGVLIRSRMLTVVFAIPLIINTAFQGLSLDCLGQIWDKPKVGYQPWSNESLRKGW